MKPGLFSEILRYTHSPRGKNKFYRDGIPQDMILPIFLKGPQTGA
jgi:hypothetical protein